MKNRGFKGVAAKPLPLHAMRAAFALRPSVAALFFGLLGAAAPADAARPLITDDARLVDPGACQVESWVKRNRDSTEYWALPACNATGNLELTLGGSRTHDADGTHTTDVQAQGKTLFKPLETNGWGFGMVAGTVRHPQVGARDWFAYVPISLSFAEDRVVIHTNIGWVREGLGGDGRRGRHRATWGVGSETRLAERAWLIAEVFGQHQGRASHQVGLRYWIVTDRVQLDATYGNKAGDRLDDRWFSIGLRLLSPPFIPGGR